MKLGSDIGNQLVKIDHTFLNLSTKTLWNNIVVKNLGNNTLSDGSLLFSKSESQT